MNEFFYNGIKIVTEVSVLITLVKLDFQNLFGSILRGDHKKPYGPVPEMSLCNLFKDRSHKKLFSPEL